MVAIEYAIMNDIYDEYIAMEGFGKKKKGKNIFQRILGLFRKVLDKIYHFITGKKTKHQKDEEFKKKFEEITTDGKSSALIIGGFVKNFLIALASIHACRKISRLISNSSPKIDKKSLYDIHEAADSVNQTNKRLIENYYKLEDDARNGSVDKDAIRKSLTKHILPLKSELEKDMKDTKEALDRVNYVDANKYRAIEEFLHCQVDLLDTINKFITLANQLTQ